MSPLKLPLPNTQAGRPDSQPVRSESRLVSRRGFLIQTSAVLAASKVGWSQPQSPRRPVVLVRFGGGVRAMDALGEQGRRSHCPGLLSIAKAGTLVPHMWTDVAGRHDIATRQLLTGRTSSSAPLLSELARDALDLPETKALAAGVTGFSEAAGHGIPHRALSFEAPLATAEATSLSGDPSLGPADLVFSANERILRIAGELGDRAGRSAIGWQQAIDDAVDADLVIHPHGQHELHPALKSAIRTRLAKGETYIAAEDADDWTTQIALNAMALHRPELTTIAFSTPDLAHQGPWRTYTRALRRIDQLLLSIQRFLDKDAFYRGRTTLVVTPDIGRGTERFDSHDPSDDAVRRLFLVAKGPRIRAGHVVGSQHNQLDIAPTLARTLGFDLTAAEGSPITEISA